MRFTALASALTLPALAVLAAIGGASGCAPINLGAIALNDGTGGSSSSGGFGGTHNDFDAGRTSSGETGSGGGQSILPTKSLSYLCGGSQPGCSTDPTSSDCAPGGNANMGGAPPDGSTRTCQLVAGGDQIQAVCAMAGAAAAGDVCTSATACQAGLGCAATDVPDLALCQPFCCSDPETCPSATYCKRASLIGTQFPIPVCAPVTQCQLLNDAAWCKPGQTCAIVRNDGTTSCIDAGQSQADGICPCAAGYTCSNATGTCLKLCHIGGDECGKGTCQGGTKPYPADIGFCVMM